MGLIDYTESEDDQVWFLLLSASTIVGLLYIFLQGVELITSGKMNDGILTIAIGGAGLFIFLAFQFVRLRAKSDDGTAGQKRYIHLGSDTKEELSISLFLGGGLWYLLSVVRDTGFLASVGNVLPVIPLSTVFSTATENLNPATEMFVHVLAFPFVEEGLFLAAIPLVLIGLFDRLEIESPAIRMIGIIAVVAPLFAGFHVGEATFSGFWIAAFVFRTLMTFAIFGDINYGAIPGIAVQFPFIIGAHIANNLYQLGGPVKYYTTVSADPLLLITSFAVFGIYGYWAVIPLVSPVATAVREALA